MQTCFESLMSFGAAIQRVAAPKNPRVLLQDPVSRKRRFRHLAEKNAGVQGSIPFPIQIPSQRLNPEIQRKHSASERPEHKHKAQPRQLQEVTTGASVNGADDVLHEEASNRPPGSCRRSLRGSESCQLVPAREQGTTPCSHYFSRVRRGHFSPRAGLLSQSSRIGFCWAH